MKTECDVTIAEWEATHAWLTVTLEIQPFSSMVQYRLHYGEWRQLDDDGVLIPALISTEEVKVLDDLSNSAVFSPLLKKYQPGGHVTRAHFVKE